MNNNLVSTAWLADQLGSTELTIIDASWHLPATKRNARAEFVENHIPGAGFYDLDAGADPTSRLPHMLPTAEKFAADMAACGVNSEKTVVVYDASSVFSAARLWWMLKTSGHAKVSVLDGGLPKWLNENRPTQSGETTIAHGNLKVAFDVRKIRVLDQVAEALTNNTAQIADARSGTRFRGEEPEPRPGVRPGHMPNSINVHYASLMNSDGTMKRGAALRAGFEAAGIELSRPIITSCGSGVTAAILTLGLTELGHEDHALYDGSWADWGTSTEAVATGP
jgi:thiosulfate/3-mercaptopyruvate sulfurtransferase